MNMIRTWIAGSQRAFRPVIHHDNNSPSLSVVVVETLLLALVLILGSNTLVTLLSQWAGLTFRTYTLISLLTGLACLAASVIISLREIQQARERDYGRLAGLFLLGMVCAMLASVIKTTNGDNQFYVSNALYFLDHPNEPMDFAIHFLVPSPGKTIISPIQGTSLSFDYLRAVLASSLNLKFLDTFYFFGVPAAFMLPVVYFLLMHQFSKDAGQALTGATFCVALVLISLDNGNIITSPNGRSIGKLAIWYSYYGKFIFLTVGIPLFVALSMKFLALPSMKNWVFLVATSIAFAGMSTTALLLMPILASILLMAAVLSMTPTLGYLQNWRGILLSGVAYLSSVGVLIVYTLYLIFWTRGGDVGGDSFTLPGQVTFIEHLWHFSNPKFLFTPLLMAASIILVLVYLRGQLRIFLLSWAALLIIFFLNPPATAILIDRVVPRNIYWRLFYLVPYPISLALVLIDRSARQWKTHAALAIGMLAVGVVAQGVVANRQGIISLSPTEYHDPGRSVAQRIVDVAPAGPMLAPRGLSRLITMLDGFHPQISIRHDGMEFWLDPEDASLRVKAAGLVNGDMNRVQDFKEFLKRNMARSVVLRRVVLEKDRAGTIQTILHTNGFVHQRTVGAYLVVWK